MLHIPHASKRAPQKLRQHLLTHAGVTSTLKKHAPAACDDAQNTAAPGLASAENATGLSRQSLEFVRPGNIAHALSLVARAAADAEHYRVKADILRHCGNLDEAIGVAPTSVARHPHDALSWGLLGDLLREQKDLQASKDCNEAAIRLNPSVVEAIHNLATILQLLEKNQEAEFHYREVLKHAHITCKRLLAVTLLNKLRRYQEALAAVEGIIVCNPKIPNPRQQDYPKRRSLFAGIHQFLHSHFRPCDE